MISNLINHFSEHTIRLQSAIADDDTETITELDHQISQIWNQILAYEPGDQKETHEMIKFLLDHLAGEQEQREIDKCAKTKILDIVRCPL